MHEDVRPDRVRIVGDIVVLIVRTVVLVTVAAQILSKSGRDEQATLVTVAGLVVVFLMLVQEIGNLFDTVRGIFGF